MAKDVLIDLLREQVKEAEQELHNLRSSLRYQIGDIALQALPFSWRSCRILPRLWKLYRHRKLSVSVGQEVSVTAAGLPESALLATDLGLGAGLKGETRFWATADTELMAQRLFADVPVNSIVLRILSLSVARQLGRLQQNGARIIWWPDPAVEHSPVLVSYVAALADECRSGEAV